MFVLIMSAVLATVACLASLAEAAEFPTLAEVLRQHDAVACGIGGTILFVSALLYFLNLVVTLIAYAPTLIRLATTTPLTSPGFRVW